jgi:hypothetical protein
MGLEWPRYGALILAARDENRCTCSPRTCPLCHRSLAATPLGTRACVASGWAVGVSGIGLAEEHWEEVEQS